MIALSHSRLSDYEQCPLKFKMKYLDKKFPAESDSPHLIRGSNVHKALENYVVKKMSDQVNIPPSSLPEVEGTKPFVDKLFMEFDEVMPEAQLAVDVEWNQCEWFSKSAYYRAIIDLIAKGESAALVVDWKTGKMHDYGGYGGQLHLTAAMVMCVYPQFEEVTTTYAYVDHKKAFPVKFQRAELPALIKHFDDKSAEVNADTEFKPTPNEFCKYCPATKAMCKYSRKM